MMRSTSSPAIDPASLVAVRCASSKYAGTVMTAWVTVSPRYDSASLFSLPRMRAEISCAVYGLPSMSTVQLVPMWRFTERMVRSGLVMAWRFATSPTSTSPVLEKPTTEGVVRPPSAFGITTGSPASNTLTTELVVPRSIPTALAISAIPSALSVFCRFRPAPLCPDSASLLVRCRCRFLLWISVAKLSPLVSRFLMQMLATPVSTGPDLVVSILPPGPPTLVACSIWS